MRRPLCRAASQSSDGLLCIGVVLLYAFCFMQYEPVNVSAVFADEYGRAQGIVLEESDITASFYHESFLAELLVGANLAAEGLAQKV